VSSFSRRIPIIQPVKIVVIRKAEISTVQFSILVELSYLRYHRE
jgi:hypothetical protein